MQLYGFVGMGAMQDIHNRPATLLWKIEAMFRLVVKSATYVNTRDSGKVSSATLFTLSSKASPAVPVCFDQN